MAVYRDALGNIDRQEFENHLKARTRKEGYMEIIMYTPDTSIQVADISSEDKLSLCDMSTMSDIDKYTSSTIATLEENLWLLNGRFIIYQGGTVNGYISDSISDDNGEFSANPTMKVELGHTSDIENFSVMLNSAVPTGYPKSINIHCYDSSDNLLGTVTENIEWQEDTGEVDDEGNAIYRTVVLDSIPSVNFELNQNGVSYLIVEFVGTRFRHRRIRVSSILFGKTMILDQDDVLNVDYTDKTSYVCDTLPSRTFSFDLNNYDSIYNIDNPDNGYVKLGRQTRVRFRNGYNVYGYLYDENGYVIMEDNTPKMDLEQDGVEIEWDNWKELRLMSVSANADESATFTAGSLLDIMDDTYTEELYTGSPRTIQEIAENILTFEGLDLNSIEWSSDGIKKPTYSGSTLLPYDQWEDTSYGAYTINTPVPETACKEVIQLLAFTVGATILIKDNGRIKFANLDIADKSTFTNNYEWDYSDFESIPAAEQLETVSTLTQLSLPKYYSYLDQSGEETFVASDGSVYSNCSVLSTVELSAINNEVTYSDALPIGCRMSDEDTSGATITYTKLYCKRGIIQLGGYVAGTNAKVEILGYPIRTKQVQERDVTSNSLILDTQIMNYDINKYNSSGLVTQSEQIKRKYLTWYQKKFKYSLTSRGEPLINAGDYGVIQTQFTSKMPVYILENHWSFDGSWSGDMEVIALD